MKVVHSHNFGSFYVAAPHEPVARRREHDTVREEELALINRAIDVFGGEAVQFLGRRREALSKAG